MKKMDDQSQGTLLRRLRTAALSGGASGALLGGLHAAVSPKSTLETVLLNALKSGALGAVAAPSGLAAGEAILGHPKDGEVNPYTHRGLVGGAALGAGLGGLGAAYLASGKKFPLAKLGSFGAQLDEKIAGGLSQNNLVANKLRSWASNPSAGNLTKAALLGSGVGAAAGGGFSAGEGEEADILSNENDAMHRRRMARQRGYNGG